jgi:hypothetical protein
MMTVLDDSNLTVRRCRQMGPPRDGGVLFEACDESPYKSLDAHRSESGTKHPKSIWNKSISRADECHMFCQAKLRAWHDSYGNCWAIARDGDNAFGSHGERLAFFWAPINDPDPWHGFPVAGRKGLPFSRRLPDELVEQWEQEGLISFGMKLRLLKERS